MTPRMPWVHLFLISAVIAAWGPLLGAVQPVADDFAYATISSGGLTGYLAALGPWRPLGQHLPVALFLADATLPPLLVLVSHGAATILLYHACRALFGGFRLPLAGALAFGVVPVGYEALAWLISYNYVPAVVFFLANICLLRNAAPGPGAFALGALFAFLGALGNECLFFASIISGGLAIPRSRGLAFAPAAGCLLWLAVRFAASVFGIDPSGGRSVSFNFAAFASPYLHSYSLFDAFQPLFSPVTRNMMFHGWTAPVGAVIVAAVAAGGFAAWKIRGSPLPASPSVSGVGLPGLVACLLSGSFVYVLNGGFSLDSRKKYALLPLLLLAGAWLWRRMRLHTSDGAFRAACLLGTAVALPATWTVVGVWKHEARKYNDLAAALAEANPGSVRVEWEPDIHSAWPAFERSVGFRFDHPWALNLAIEGKGGKPVTVAADAPTVARVDRATGHWILDLPR